MTLQKFTTSKLQSITLALQNKTKNIFSCSCKCDEIYAKGMGYEENVGFVAIGFVLPFCYVFIINLQDK